MITRQECRCVFTESTRESAKVIYMIKLQECSCVLTEGTCDSGKVLFI